MFVVVVTPPAPVVTLAEAKAHLRVDFNDDDDLIGSFVETATQWIDGPQGWLRRCLGEQTLEAIAPGFAAFTRPSGPVLCLPYPPVIAIESITYLDRDGASQTLDVEAYRTLPGGLALPASGAVWPAAGLHPDAVRIRYIAGYRDQPGTDDAPAKSTVPAPIRQAILLMVAALYEDREATSDDILGTRTVKALLAPFRLMRV
ncbi:head-tail connector protein [Chelatococcus sp.]|uniref:head-tail connector protein n=1 Tax=Chelatococcus sp. TaxID=1953771 RepID=UPI001EBB5E44|nr:head-tail connector protein [Chelatococcus sp.]MBX3543585.1 head-tail connector protein [Chelatococcus sp.]